MAVDPATSTHRAEHHGTTYHFCAARCHDRFVAEPERYLSPQPPAAAAPAPAGAVYICPMHPEVRQDHPGTCPICGMALEPELPRSEEHTSELQSLMRN